MTQQFEQIIVKWYINRNYIFIGILDGSSRDYDNIQWAVIVSLLMLFNQGMILVELPETNLIYSHIYL